MAAKLIVARRVRRTLKKTDTGLQSIRYPFRYLAPRPIVGSDMRNSIVQIFQHRIHHLGMRIAMTIQKSRIGRGQRLADPGNIAKTLHHAIVKISPEKSRQPHIVIPHGLYHLRTRIVGNEIIDIPQLAPGPS